MCMCQYACACVRTLVFVRVYVCMHVCTHLRVRSHTHTLKRAYNESNEQLCTIPPGKHLSSFSNKSPVFEFRAIGEVLGSDFGLA